MKKLIIMTLVLFALSACFSTGGRMEPPSTIEMIEEVVESEPKQPYKQKYVSQKPVTVTEPITDPEIGMDPVVEWEPSQPVIEETEQPQLRPKPIADPAVRSSHYQIPDDRTYTGQVIGTINPSYSHLSDPRIELSYDTGLNSIRASISYEDSNGVRETLDSYGGVRIDSDGSFSLSKGLSKLSGTIFGDNKVIVGNVSTPRLHGSFVAETE